MSHLSDTLEDIAKYNAYTLTRYAQCATPDTPDSAGSHFLTSIRDQVVELLTDPDSLDDLLCDRLDDDGSLSEIADNAPDIYTATFWAEFVDLDAWQEDPTDLGFEGSDMEQGARICLYVIAERLVNGLVQEAQEAAQEDADEEE